MDPGHPQSPGAGSKVEVDPVVHQQRHLGRELGGESLDQVQHVAGTGVLLPDLHGGHPAVHRRDDGLHETAAGSRRLRGVGDQVERQVKWFDEHARHARHPFASAS